MTQPTETMITGAVERWMPDAEVQRIEPLTPDASLRRYYRIYISAAPQQSLVAMIFDSVASPEVDGAVRVDADDAYVKLTEVLSRAGVRVPELYSDQRQAKLLLIEDLGDRHLIEVASAGTTSESRTETASAYAKAIEQLALLQSIPVDPELFAFRRAFSAPQYQGEMMEFHDFILSARGAAPEILSRFVSRSSALAGELAGLPKVLVHRDFHSWNLMVDAAANVRVIDFQDALLGTRWYDVVALLNDRDTDTVLGPTLYRSLLAQFFKRIGARSEHLFEYLLVLLQRDLKVAGRFAKLSAVRGLKQYEQWIPGTLRRIGRTLDELSRHDPGAYSELLEDLRALVSEVREGAGDGPWVTVDDV